MNLIKSYRFSLLLLALPLASNLMAQTKLSPSVREKLQKQVDKQFSVYNNSTGNYKLVFKGVTGKVYLMDFDEKKQIFKEKSEIKPGVSFPIPANTVTCFQLTPPKYVGVVKTGDDFMAGLTLSDAAGTSVQMAITRRTKGDKTPLWQYLDKADKEKFKEAIDAMEGSRDNAGFFINDLLIPENHPRLPK